MKLKYALSLALFLTAALLVAYYVRLGSSDQPSERVGQKVLLPEIFSQASEVHIEDTQNAVTLRFIKNEVGAWVIPDYYGLPVEFNKFRRLLTNLTEAEVVRVITRDPQRITEKLEIGQKHIRLLSATNEVLWELKVGKDPEGSGAYIQLNQEPEALLVDRTLFFDTQKDNWASTALLGLLKTENVAEFHIAFMEESEPLILKRSSPQDPFSYDKLAKNQELQQSEVNGLLDSLLNARYAEIVEASDPDAVAAKSYPIPFTIKLFNGETYTLKLGRRPPQLNELDADGLSDKASERELSDPGPVFIFYEFEDIKDSWVSEIDDISFVFPESIYELIPDQRTDFIKTSESPSVESSEPKTSMEKATAHTEQ